jgi:PilZ domain
MTDPTERRRHMRVLGPFDATRPGTFDMSLQIYDLSAGGCFVNSIHDAPPKGQVFVIQIDLPDGGTIAAKGETAFVRPGFGYGVRFHELSEETRNQLESALENSGAGSERSSFP